MPESKKTSKPKADEAKPKRPKIATVGAKSPKTGDTEAVASTTIASAADPGAAALTTDAPAKPAKKPPKSQKEEATAVQPPRENLSLDPDEVEKPKVVKAKGSKNVHSGIAHVLSTFNNTIVTITDMTGKVIGWSSAGKVGFKGSRKSTAYAAQMVAQDASRQAMGHGLKEVEVRVKGPGAGRESAVRALQAIGLDLSVIRDVTPVPHNGCRPPKQRRV